MLKMGSKITVTTPAPAKAPAVEVKSPVILEATSTKKVYKEKVSAAEKLMSSPSGTAAEIMAALQDKKGAHIVTLASAIPPVERLATGIFELDFFLCGGFPFNRYSIIYGPESSNKTNIALKAVAAAQRLPGPNNVAVWVNLEQTFDPLWAQMMGVDIDRLLVVNASYGEEAVDIIDGLARGSDVVIVVVDSVATLTAAKEIGQSTETADVGLSPLLIKRLVNKLMYVFAEKKRLNQRVCVILINQIRFKIGQMFGDPETMPGGEAQKFLASLRIRVQAKNEIVKTVNPHLHVFKNTTVKIIKSKIPVLSNEFTFSLCMVAHDELNVGDTRSWSLVEKYLKSLDFLKKGVKDKGWVLAVPGTTMNFSTLAQIEDQYVNDADFQAKLQGVVIEAFKGQAALVEDPSESNVPSPPAGTMMFQGVK